MDLKNKIDIQWDKIKTEVFDPLGIEDELRKITKTGMVFPCKRVRKTLKNLIEEIETLRKDILAYRKVLDVEKPRGHKTNRRLGKEIRDSSNEYYKNFGKTRKNI